MPIQFKSKLASAVANATFLDKTIDDTTIGKISMENTNSANIDDPQNYINELADTTGQAGEGDATRKDYSSNNFILDGDNRKVAIGKLDTQVKVNEDDITAIESDYGVANGLATLDGTGRLPSSQLTLDAVQYKGTWDANTNTPTLIDGTGTTGDFYVISVAGTQDLGSGSLTFALGDRVFYNGTIWEKVTASDIPVTSVFTRTGDIVAVSGDYTADQIDETSTRYFAIKHNRDAIVDPTINDDSDDDYSVGSKWFNSVNESEFTLQDATVGAANWIETGGAGGGAGGINYLIGNNTDFESGTGDWIGDTNLVLSQETTTPLRGSGSLKIAKAAADSSGEQVYIDFTIDEIDLAKKLTITMDKDFSTTPADGDFILKIVGDPSGTPFDVAVNGAEIRADKTQYIAQFQTDATEKDYRLIIEAVTTDATAYDLFIDTVVVGPRVVANSAFITNWESFTPTVNNFTLGNGTVTGHYKRNGDSIDVEVSIILGSTSSITGTLSVDYPQSLQKDSAKVSTNSVNSTVELLDNSTSANRQIGTVRPGSTNLLPLTNTSAVVNATSPFTWATDDTIKFTAYSIPIQGWASNAVSSEDLGVRSVTVKGAGNAGTVLTGGVTLIDFIEVEDSTASWSGTLFTAPETGRYSFTGSVPITASVNTVIQVYKNDVYDGVAGSLITSTLHGISREMDLLKGETLDFRSFANVTLTNSSTNHRLYIHKIANPQTILETETVYARATSNSGPVIPSGVATVVDFEDVSDDSHGKITTGASWQWKCPASGWHNLKASVAFAQTTGWAAGNLTYLTIRKGGSDMAIDADQNTVTGINEIVQRSVTDSFYIEKDETIDCIVFQDSGVGRTMESTSGTIYNRISIERVK